MIAPIAEVLGVTTSGPSPSANAPHRGRGRMAVGCGPDDILRQQQGFTRKEITS